MNYTSSSTLTRTGGAAVPRIAPLLPFSSEATLPTTQDWSLKVDVHLDPVAITSPGQFTDVFLGFGKTGDWVNTHVTFEFDRALWYGGYYDIGDDVRINGDDAPGLFNVFNLVSPDAALRMDYSATNHTVTYYFDSDGAANGYNWVAQGTANLASGTYNLNLSPSDTFTIFLLGSSGYQNVAVGQAYLSNLEITVNQPGPPAITSQPVSRTNTVGTTATFTVVATGAAPLAYQWRFNGTNLLNGGTLSGVTTTNLTIANVQMTNAGDYSVVVTNTYGSVTSSVAVLTVPSPVPVITSQPVSRTNTVGTAATFTVTATSIAPLTYQWRFNGTNLANGGNVSGATTADLTLTNVQLTNAGNYSAVVINPYGSVTSAPAVLTVGLPPRLQITRSGPQVLLSWLTNPPDFVLETSSNLSAVTVWRVVTNTVTISGNRFWVTNQSASSPAFYRLRQQASSPAPAGMVLIPAGPFVMGDTLDGSSSALPLHTNQISAFYMDKYEVTKALWDEVRVWALTNGYSFDYAGSGKATNHPVHIVNWWDCVKWSNARSEKAGLVPAYYTSPAQTTVYRTGQLSAQNDWVKWNSGYRLPTEAEWEKAARGRASGQRFPWGNTITHSNANYHSVSSSYYAYDTSPTRGYHPSFQAGGTPYTSPVGYFAPNGYGLYDMAGNLWEWTWDWWGSYTAAPATDPRGPGGVLSYRVLRGSGWNDGAGSARCADRVNYLPLNANLYIGFRCVRGL
jgi:formylglycine-generating enzyme required for sulfatase activity